MNKNNNKLTQQKTKTRKSSFILGVGLGVLVAGSTATLLTTIGKTHGETLKYNLNFALSENDKAQGATLTGKTKFDFKNEIYLSEIQTPVAEKTVQTSTKLTNYPFVDWIDENGLTVKYNDAITGTTKLTATFSDYWERKGVTLYNITFKTEDPELYMTGITKLAVPEGRTFASINKPQVYSTNPAKNKFKGWALEDAPTYAVNQDLIITQNLVFVPVFATSVLINYNTRDNETKTAGTLQVTTEAGVKFGEINQPTIARTDSEAFMFAGWTKDAQGTEDWSSDEEITTTIPTGGYQAWAKWLAKADPTTAIIDFVQNTTQKQPFVNFKGSLNIAAKVDSLWSQINRPTPEASGWKLSGWEYSKDQGETKTWTILTGQETFDMPASQGHYFVRPVMTPNADAVKILGKDIAVQGLSTQYTAFVAPAEADQTVTWSLWADATCSTPLPESVAKITSTGLLKVFNGDSRPIYIKATSVVDTEGKVFDVKKVTLIPPYFDSYDYFTFSENVSDPSLSKWYKLTGLDGNGQIQVWDGENLITEYDRSEFNKPVFVGNRIKTLPGQFLSRCTSYNQPIVWTDKLQNIGPYFMYECESFDQKIDLSNIQNIDKEFMFCCRAFNNGSTTNDINKLDLTHCLSIGEGFLEQCNVFNSTIDLGTSILYIGNEFMNQCEKFSRNITFPSSLLKIGDNCMHNCYDFTSTIYVNTPADRFGNSDLNFSGDKKTAKIFDQGFTIDGSYKQKFEEKFGTIEYPSTSETGSAYRKVEGIADFETCTWKKLGQLATNYENKTITADEFFKKVKVNNKVPTSFSEYVGAEKKLLVNGAEHIVRCVAVNFDELADSTTKALFTFEFKSLVSDSDGTPLGCFWNHNSKDTSHYLNSTLYRCLTGKGTATYGWYRGGKTYSNGQVEYQKPLIDMVDADFKSQIKTIKRTVPQKTSAGSSDWKEVSYTTNFYMPFLSELSVTSKGIGWTKDAGGKYKVYDYYKNISHTNTYQWIHKPVNTDWIFTQSQQESLSTKKYVYVGTNKYQNWVINNTNHYGSAAYSDLENRKSMIYQWTGSPEDTMTSTGATPYSFRYVTKTDDDRFQRGSSPHDTVLAVAPAFAI